MDYGSLVKRIIDGDSAAEAELIAHFKDRVAHIIRRLTNDRSMVDDLWQGTFYIVIKTIRKGELKQPESLGAFVAKVARYHTIEQMREARRKGGEDLEYAEQVPDPSPSQLEQAESAEKLDDLRELIEQLLPRDRELIFRLYIKEEPKKKICADLHLSSDQFDRVLYRAKKRLRVLYLKRLGLAGEDGQT
jgi:RNA polymerase sigma-70 factor (ECF subfamily)